MPPSCSDFVDLARAVAALQRGEFILVYDGDGREEETDLTIASEFVTSESVRTLRKEAGGLICTTLSGEVRARIGLPFMAEVLRSEEHTSELQSLAYLVCRLLLE